MRPTAGPETSSTRPTAAWPRSSTRRHPTTRRAAVAAARAAFDDGAWPRTPVGDRAALLGSDRRPASARQGDARAARDRGHRKDVWWRAGSTSTTSRRCSATTPSSSAVEADRLVDVGDPTVISRVVREPIGVCVLIAPWNYPLLQMSWKVAPALAAGCTMVAKPSEVTPLSHHRVRPAARGGRRARRGGESGAGQRRRARRRADRTPLTSTSSRSPAGWPPGTTIARVAAEHVTKVAVELGGKNPHIVFADADGRDWDIAVDQVLTGVFLHSGQVCSAGTRLIVEESIADDFVAALVARAEKIRMGDGMDPASETGPLVSEQHRAKVEALRGARRSPKARSCVTGGARPTDPALANGSYYLPTIFDRCDRSMRSCRRRRSGRSSRWSDSPPRPRRSRSATTPNTVSRRASGRPTRRGANGWCARLRHGTVWLNDFGYYTAAAEWGGFRKSGNGASSAPPGSRNTRRSNTSGTTPRRRPQAGSTAMTRSRSSPPRPRTSERTHHGS